MNKIQAYKLQEQGMDTVDANLHLGFDADERDYGVGAQILSKVGRTQNAPDDQQSDKTHRPEAYGLKIVENIPSKYPPIPTTNFI